MALILIISVSSCKTTNQELKPGPELPLIKNSHIDQTEPLPLIVVSKDNQTSPELKLAFPKVSALRNLTSDQVHALLGTPSFKRSDNPAEIWQYNTNDCMLDLFLYKNLATTRRSVNHYEIRLKSNNILTKSECFEIIIKTSTQASSP